MATPRDRPPVWTRRAPLRGVGAAAVLLALLGMWHSAATLAQEAGGQFDPVDPVLFRRALFPLWGPILAKRGGKPVV